MKAHNDWKKLQQKKIMNPYIRKLYKRLGYILWAKALVPNTIDVVIALPTDKFSAYCLPEKAPALRLFLQCVEPCYFPINYLHPTDCHIAILF